MFSPSILSSSEAPLLLKVSSRIHQWNLHAIGEVSAKVISNKCFSELNKIPVGNQYGDTCDLLLTHIPQDKSESTALFDVLALGLTPGAHQGKLLTRNILF